MNLMITGGWVEALDHIDEFKAAGFDVSYMPKEDGPLPEGVAPEDVQLVLCSGLFDHRKIAEFPNLQLIQLTSVGYDHLPHADMQAAGVGFRNARGAFGIPMAEHAVGGVISLFRRLGEYRLQQERHEWEKLRGLRELAGSTVAIVGCGNVGQECAMRFKAFGCRILGVNRTPKPGAECPENFESVVGFSQLGDVLAQADVVILCTALSDLTRGMMNAERFAQMKPGAVLVNIARGPIVVEDDLVAALQAGHVGGAMLDVFEAEPLADDSPLWDMPNVIVTPHSSFIGESNSERLASIFLANLTEYAASR